jgi:hypothetical protein
MFIFLAMGFVALSLVFVEMYRYAMRLKTHLLLNDYELFKAQSLVIKWNGAAVIGVICILLAMTLPSHLVPYSGFAFLLLAFWFPLVDFRRGKKSSNLRES